MKGNVRHGFPLTINAKTYREFKKAQKLISENVGIGNEHLSTEEEKFLLDLLEKDSRSDQEKRFYEELMGQVKQEKMRVSTLKGLIDSFTWKDRDEDVKKVNRKKDKKEKRKCKLWLILQEKVK